MNKLENLLDIVKSNEVKINDLLHKKELEEKGEKKVNRLCLIFGIIAAVLLVAVIAYAVYKVFIEKPDYLDDFEDEFEDDTKTALTKKMTSRTKKSNKQEKGTGL